MQIGGRSENVIHRKRASTTIDWKTCAKINYLISQRVTFYIKINNIKKMVNFAVCFHATNYAPSFRINHNFLLQRSLLICKICILNALLRNSFSDKFFATSEKEKLISCCILLLEQAQLFVSVVDISDVFLAAFAFFII